MAEQEVTRAKREARARSPRSAPTIREQVYVPRRLRDQLALGLEAGFVAVQAPAGCGKTAVVLQFLLDEGVDPHWYTCGPDDAEPANLLTGLTKVLGRAERTGGQTALAALASTDVRQSYRKALKPLFDEFEEAHEAGIVLVIDDADALLTAPEAIEVLDYVLFALAPYARIFLLSRAELPLPSQAKPRLDGRATRVVADDLLLREDEIGACARTTYKIDLSPEEIARLYRVTAGWGIALRLALRLRDLGTNIERDERALFTPEARADLFAYLAAEVLSRVDKRIETFLRRTAILDTLDPAVCGRLTQEERPAELIQSLASAGLPVMKAGWSAYRCHSLLRDYFLDTLGDRQLREAHADAGGAFSGLGDWPQALSHFVAAGDISSALTLVDEHGRELFYTGHGRALLDLVKTAPAELLADHYRAEYWAAFAASRMFELDWAASALERVSRDATVRGDEVTAHDALRALAYMLNGWARFEPAMVVARRLLDTVPAGDIASRAAVTLGYLTTGMGAKVQFREALELTRRLLPDLSSEPRADAMSEAYARAVSAVTLAFEGDFASARAELNQADLLISGREYDVVTTFIPWSRALVEFQSGNPDGADDASRTAEEMALQFGDLQRVLECRAIRASTAVLRDSVVEADRGFAQLDELRSGGPNFWGTMFALLSLPHRARLHGDLAAARRAAEANNALAVGSGSAWFACSTRLDVANFRLLTGDSEAAREPARVALAEAMAMSADVLVYGANLMVAATGADDEAGAMAEALRIADMRDYRFLMPYGVRLPQLDAALWRALGSEAGGRAAVLLERTGPASAAALRPLIANLDEAAAVRAVGVLREFGAEGRDALDRLAAASNRRVSAAAEGALASLDAANPHGLSARELEVLQLLAQGLRTKEVAEQLVVTPATVSTHIQRIMNKTGTSSRAELLALALRELPPSAR
ncbi:MAG: LuxR C-terminal-related transcriptional regulator [Dehalococcoidia bacterium]